MKIYKVTRTDSTNYDQYDSFVCVAENENQARFMHPDHPKCIYNKELGRFQHFNCATWEWSESWTYNSYWPINSFDSLAVEEIGTAKDILAKVILASFNAG